MVERSRLLELYTTNTLQGEGVEEAGRERQTERERERESERVRKRHRRRINSAKQRGEVFYFLEGR